MSLEQSVYRLSLHLADFRIYPDGHGHWCSRKSDGMVAGTFFTREAALRFAKNESLGLSDRRLAIARQEVFSR